MTDTPPRDPVELFHRLSGAAAYAAGLPRQRYLHECVGKVLLFPRTGLIGVPYQLNRTGAAVVVVHPDRAGTYQPGGHNLDVGADELESAVEVALALPGGSDE